MKVACKSDKSDFGHEGFLSCFNFHYEKIKVGDKSKQVETKNSLTRRDLTC